MSTTNAPTVTTWRRCIRLAFGGRIRRLFWFFWFSLGLVLFFLVFVYYPTPSIPLSEKRMLEFGWDTPSLQEMPQYIEAAQTLPFNGIVMDIDTPRHELGLAWTIFSSDRIDGANLEELAKNFSGLDWGRLTDNFLRVNVYPATVDWYDDFGAVLNNIEAIARFARELGFKGVFMDTEQYAGVFLFDYSQQAYRERYSYDEYAAQVYVRGQEVMRALNQGYPGITVLHTYGLTVLSQLSAPRDLSNTHYGLLAPFIEGMIAAVDDSTSLVDAFEGSYIFDQELQFLNAYKLIKGFTRDFYARDREQYGRVVSAGFGLWLDHHCETDGLEPEGCPGGFTPESFSRALDLALRYSDRYVWIYSERINWFTGEGIPSEWKAALKLPA